jgi:hypothetical protein
VSNVFRDVVPFYPVPQALVTSGKLKNLREGAHKVYQLVLHTAQQRTRVAVELPNRGIFKEVGTLTHHSPSCPYRTHGS